MDNFENNNSFNNAENPVPEYKRSPMPQYRFVPNGTVQQSQPQPQPQPIINQAQGQNPIQNPYYNPYQSPYQNPMPMYMAPPKVEEPENIKKARKKETISLILGIISFAGLIQLFLFPLAALIPSITSILFGKSAKKELKKSGKATTGLIFSIISIVLSVIMTLIMTVFLYIPLFTLDIPLNEIQNNKESASEEIEEHFRDYYSNLFGVDIEEKYNDGYDFDDFYDGYFNFDS